MRRRLETAFDRFIDVRTMSDGEIAAHARAIGIDIAVDLAGYTESSRPGIFAARAAPVQIAYLGYPGTMGTRFMDYIVADAAIVTPAARPYFTESIIYLPHFQVNDATRPRTDRALPRADMGLPENGFVFCCFNNSYKFTPTVFASWMRILTAVPDSVLFLSSDHPIVADNLRKEAARHGVDGARLVFTKRVASEDYFARFRTADLFLDTLPFTAHTMASDALWSGLPLLTCRGQALAGRVAASLLQALDLSELITDSRADYEAAAIALALAPARLQSLRRKLEATAPTAALFNTRLFTRTIEQAYTQAHARRCAGQSPADIHIGAAP